MNNLLEIATSNGKKTEQDTLMSSRERMILQIDKGIEVEFRTDDYQLAESGKRVSYADLLNMQRPEISETYAFFQKNIAFLSSYLNFLVKNDFDILFLGDSTVEQGIVPETLYQNTDKSISVFAKSSYFHRAFAPFIDLLPDVPKGKEKYAIFPVSVFSFSPVASLHRLANPADFWIFLSFLKGHIEKDTVLSLFFKTLLYDYIKYKDDYVHSMDISCFYEEDIVNKMGYDIGNIRGMGSNFRYNCYNADCINSKIIHILLMISRLKMKGYIPICYIYPFNFSGMNAVELETASRNVNTLKNVLRNEINIIDLSMKIDKEFFSKDNVHLKDDGYRIVGKYLSNYIKSNSKTKNCCTPVYHMAETWILPRFVRCDDAMIKTIKICNEQ